MDLREHEEHEEILGGTTVQADREVCDVCGSTDIVEIKCKVMCRNCGTILRSCSDL